MESLFSDIRYAFRGILKRPGFTAIAVITLALGIGANTAIFTLVNAVTLKSLPVTRPQELVLFQSGSDEGTSNGDPSSGEWRRFSYDSYRYFVDHDQSYQSLSAFRSGESRVSVASSQNPSGEAQRASSHLVSGNYFSVLGVNAFLGRTLTPSDDQAGAPPAVVMSYGYWKEQWSGNPQIINREIVINGRAFTVVGVTPPEFFGIRVRRAPDLWVPLVFQPEIEMRESYLKAPRVYWLNFVGRLKPGVKFEQAQASANLLLRQFLTSQTGTKLTDDDRKAIAGASVGLAPGGRGISGLRIAYSRALQMLMVIVGLVLLIACANVGNLLLSRTAARKAEISLRLALGASRGRVVRQLLTESFLLAVIGGIAGILLAQGGVKVLVTLVAKTSPLDVQPDLGVLAFTAGVSMTAGLLFGTVPALRATKTDLTTAIKEKSSRTSRFGLASVLVIAQVGLSMVLLAGAGLFSRSLIKLQEENVGFNRDNVLVVRIDPRLGAYKPTELSALYRQLLDRIKDIPGVQSATVATYSPISGTGRSSTITVRGYTARSDEDMEVSDMLIGPDYGATLGLPLILGREIDKRDTPAGAKVAVVSQSFAEYFFHGENPIGRRFYFGDENDPERSDDVEIVGVVGDVKYDNARTAPARTAYRPILQVQDGDAYSSTLEIRTVGEPTAAAPMVRGAIRQIDPKLPVFGVTSLREQLSGALQQEKLVAELVSFFGLLALLLACVGLYGVMAHGVVRRTKEIGIRMALGAERSRIVWMVMRETILLVLIGIVLGVPAALGAAKLVSSQLFGLSPSDPFTLLVAATVLIAVASLAGLLPARKASKVNPLTALRYE
jgi:predicted permease